MFLGRARGVRLCLSTHAVFHRRVFEPTKPTPSVGHGLEMPAFCPGVHFPQQVDRRLPPVSKSSETNDCTMLPDPNQGGESWRSSVPRGDRSVRSAKITSRAQIGRTGMPLWPSRRITRGIAEPDRLAEERSFGDTTAAAGGIWKRTLSGYWELVKREELDSCVSCWPTTMVFSPLVSRL